MAATSNQFGRARRVDDHFDDDEPEVAVRSAADYLKRTRPAPITWPLKLLFAVLAVIVGALFLYSGFLTITRDTQAAGETAVPSLHSLRSAGDSATP
jgi:hypothetical protein